MKISILGAFGFDRIHETTGGQPVKTRELYYGLCEKYDKKNIFYTDTYLYRKKPIKFIFSLLKTLRKSDILIMLPAQNGLKVFSKIIFLLKPKKCKVFYDVIGGWLPDFILDHKKIIKHLKKMNGIWVEMNSMKIKLEKEGLNNVVTIPNFKTIHLTSMPYDFSKKEFNFCTFSRVMEEKGIENAMEAVVRLNREFQNNYKIHLDIYGPVDVNYQNRFNELLNQKEISDLVSYKGIVNPNDSVEILKKYYALLFPTFYSGEGFAGTLLDALFSGIPVIASDWKYNCDIILDGKNGLIYQVKNIDDLVAKMRLLIQNPNQWEILKQNCLLEAQKYMRENVLQMITSEIERG